MKTLTAFRIWMTLIIVLISLIASGCASPTPAPTVEPAVTLAPPTPTPTSVPTATPLPVPSLKNAMFATNPDMKNPVPQDGTLDAGPTSIYFSIDHADIPAEATLNLELKRDGNVILNRSDSWQGSATGTYTQVLLTDPHLIVPGLYKLTIKLATQTLEGRFKVSAMAGQPGATLLVENFDDNQLNWYEHSDKFYSAELDSGQLLLTSHFPNQVAFSEVPVEFQDFDLSVDVQLTSTSTSGYYGIAVRYNDGSGSGYFLTVSAGGVFDFSVNTVGGGFKPLLAAQTSTAIHRGTASNHVRIVAQGKKFAIYINGTLVGAITNDQLPSGSIAFIANDAKQSNVSVQFDNLKLTLPKEDVVIVPTKIVPKGTPAPKATAVPKTPPLATVILQTIDLVNAFKGALFGGGESCADFFKQFNGIVNAPTFDVTGQPSSIQGAYGLYRQAITVAGSKAGVFNDICSSGGGFVGKLDVLVEIKLLDQALDLLSQASRLLQP